MEFIDRETELAELNELEILSKKKLFVIAIYGLRRVGKTRLLLEFLKNRGVYFFVNKNKTSTDLLGEFQAILKEKKILRELETLGSWDRFFETLITRETPPVVFDEFQNFTFVEPAVFGILQKTIDLNENKPGLIILSGSLIGLIKKLFKNSKEPLYGRVKKGKKLEPLPLASCLEIRKELKLTKENLVKVYMLFGGYPKYYVALEDFNLQGKSAEEMIDTLFLVKDAPLEDEVNSILSQEFGGRSGLYYSILEAIATGNNTLSSIAGYLNIQATSITRQINELRDHFELIGLELPYQGKRGIYRIRHPLIEFWFSQIYKNFSDYVARRPEFIASIKKNLNALYGRCFERVAKEFLVRELKLAEARRQWGKIPQAKKGENSYEIDLMAKKEKLTYADPTKQVGSTIHNQRDKTRYTDPKNLVGCVYAFEFKWKELSYSETRSILNGLQDKTKYLSRLPKNLQYGVVAKKIKDKQKLRANGYLVYDLDDF